MHLSSLTALATTHLLTSPRFPEIVEVARARLAHHHALAVSRLQAWDIPFVSAQAGPFVFARLAPTARNTADEEATMKRLRSGGVTVTPGSQFGGGKEAWGSMAEDAAGWARITVAVPESQLLEGLEKIGRALGLEKSE